MTGMEDVLAAHYDVELEHGYWSCICGERFGVLLPDELHRAHVTKALALAGFGNLHDAWEDGAEALTDHWANEQYSPHSNGNSDPPANPYPAPKVSET